MHRTLGGQPTVGQQEVETHLESEHAGAQYTVEEYSEVSELTFTRAGLRTLLATSPLGSLAWIWVEYLFDQVSALRYLRTADLSPHWRGEALDRGYHLHRVSSGGWLEQELRTPGMLDVTSAVGAPPEWLVTTSRQSLNVLGSEPLVRERRRSAGGRPDSHDARGAGRSPRKAATLGLAAEPSGPMYSAASSDIVELALASPGSDGLRVVVATRAKSGGESICVEYLFTRCRGFRCLDEGDLARFWASDTLRPGHHLYRIVSGGWLDQELGVSGMFSTAGGSKEWLIATGGRSASVLAGEEPPLVREFRWR